MAGFAGERIQRSLFGTSATDAGIRAVLALLLLLVPAVAALAPARRGIAVDPQVVLRSG